MINAGAMEREVAFGPDTTDDDVARALQASQAQRLPQPKVRTAAVTACPSPESALGPLRVTEKGHIMSVRALSTG